MARVDLSTRHEALAANTREALAGVRHVLRHWPEIDPLARENLSEAAARLDAALLADSIMDAPGAGLLPPGVDIEIVRQADTRPIRTGFIFADVPYALAFVAALAVAASPALASWDEPLISEWAGAWTLLAVGAVGFLWACARKSGRRGERP